jgi:hypothetical protein
MIRTALVNERTELVDLITTSVVDLIRIALVYLIRTAYVHLTGWH